MTFSLADLHETVSEAWEETLGPDYAGPDVGWEASGADSLMTMHLVLRLEKRLGRKIPYDLIDPETTLQLLVERLSADCAEQTKADRYPVYLSPGLFGDEPVLADFRRWFSGDPAFAVVDLPAATEPTAVLEDVHATGRRLAEAILARQPEGPIAVAGFSFGGAVAFEAAAILADQGREISLCLILDTHIDDEAQKTSGYRPRRGLWARELVTSLLAPRSNIVRRALIRMARRFPGGADVRLSRRYLLRLRGRALLRWRPRRVAFPLLLAISDDAEPELLGRWQSRSDQFSFVAVPGGHKEIFRPVAMERLGPALKAALQEEGAVARRA